MSTRSSLPHARSAVLLVVTLCLAVGVLAAPGFAAAADPTSITAKAQSSTVTWGAKTVITGTLMDDATITALGGLWLRVEWSYTGSPASWVRLSDVTTEGDALYATGQYSQAVQPSRLTYYRFLFLGNAAYEASTSNVLMIKVRPYLGRPVAPKAVRRGRLFTVRGTLKPRFKAGAKTVRIKVYRAKGHKWVAVKRLRATNYDTTRYSKYVLRTRLTTRGKYRFRAYTYSSANWARAQSKLSKTMVVR